jgi:hypothetical protein
VTPYAGACGRKRPQTAYALPGKSVARDKSANGGPNKRPEAILAFQEVTPPTESPRYFQR